MSLNNFNEIPNINNGFVYARVSSPQQNNDSNGNLSLSSQLQNAKNFCTHFNIPVVKSECDVGSAYKNPSKSQYGLNFLIKNMNKNDILVISDVSRFTRNFSHANDVMKKFTKKECYIYSLTDKIWFNNPYRPADNEIFQQKILDSQKESSNISHRVKRSIMFRKNRGDKIGKAPWGRKAVRDSNGRRVFVINEEEIKISKIAHNLVYNLNMTFQKAADELNKKYSYGKNKSFTANSIKNTILKCKTFNLNDISKEIEDISKDIDDISKDFDKEYEASESNTPNSSKKYYGIKNIIKKISYLKPF